MTDAQRREAPVDQPIVRCTETGRDCLYLGDHAEHRGMSYVEARAHRGAECARRASGSDL
jgi:hypothetical protein